MKTFVFLSVIAISLAFFFTPESHSFALPQQPPLWNDDFGDELEDLTLTDNFDQMVTLPFPFPFNGNTYNTAYVGLDGCIQFDGLGFDDAIYYDNWIYMEQFLADSDPDNPLFCPFNTDLISFDIGTVYYNDSGNPLIFTWDGVGAYFNTDEPSTFQVLLYDDGRIVFNFNGILPDGDILQDFGDGIVIGITPSDLEWDGEPIVPGDPGPNDLNGPSAFYDRATIYERWCLDEADSCGTEGISSGLPGPPNDEFDLDFHSICFLPQGGGFQVSSAGSENPDFVCDEQIVVTTTIPTLSEWGLIAMAGVLGIIGLLAVRRRKVTV